MRCSPSVPERLFAIFRENRSRAHGERMKTKRHFVQPTRNHVIQLVTPTRALQTTHPQTSAFFFNFFCFVFFGLQKLAHLSIYLHTKCSRSVSEKIYHFSEKIDLLTQQAKSRLLWVFKIGTCKSLFLPVTNCKQHSQRGVVCKEIFSIQGRNLMKF